MVRIGASLRGRRRGRWSGALVLGFLALSGITLSEATYTSSTANPSSFGSGQLTGIHAPLGGSTVTANDDIAGTCTVSWGSLSGGTTVAETYELRDLVTGSVLATPGNVGAASQGYAPGQTVGRAQLRTRAGTNWVSGGSDSVSLGCALPDVRSVTVGRNSACAIRSDDTLWCWGANHAGQLGLGASYFTRATPTKVGTATWKNVSNAEDFTCGVRTTGTLWCWGTNFGGQLGVGDYSDRTAPTQVGVAATWRHVTVGYDHACATRTNGTLWCWGNNWGGQLGIGTTTGWNAPQQVGVLTTWKQVSTGGAVTCAVRTDATLWCWGLNDIGQVGDGTMTDRLSPTQVGSATTWRSVSVDSFHGCATRTNGDVWCWGANWNMQLGDNTYTNRSAPVQVVSTVRWVDVVAGLASTCAVSGGGSLACWGNDGHDQQGNGAGANDVGVPTVIDANTTWGAVSAGDFATCAVRSDASLWCWGHDGVGLLGRSTSTNASPGAVDASAWSNVAAGDGHVCAVRSDATLWCWGDADIGQTGQGVNWDVQPYWWIPQVGTQTNWSKATAGRDHTCAVKTTGTLWCWGENGEGQLGVGDTTDRNAPVQVGILSDWSAVSAGDDHTCGVKTTGTLWCWGRGNEGQLGLGNWNSYSTPQQVGVATTWSAVAAGADHTCGQRGTTGYCWGDNGSGQLGDGTTTDRNSPIGGWSTVAVVSAGSSSTCAVTTGGSLYCTGGNASGQIGDGTTTQRNSAVLVAGGITDWTDVAVGDDVACARRTTGNDVYCWGDNRFGTTGTGTQSTSVTTPTSNGADASAGKLARVGTGSTMCSIAGTSLSCWGDDRERQLGYSITSDVPVQVDGGSVYRP